jgi:hypothetical protein
MAADGMPSLQRAGIAAPQWPATSVAVWKAADQEGFRDILVNSISALPTSNDFDRMSIQRRQGGKQTSA